MGKAKTVFKIYSIPEYRKEEEFLSSMHRQGWKFTNKFMVPDPNASNLVST